MPWMRVIILLAVHMLSFMVKGVRDRDIYLGIGCEEQYQPENCDFDKIPVLTVEDYERCAPAQLPLYARNYYLGWAGRGITYKDNQEAYERIRLKPKLLRDVTGNSLEISTLGQNVAFPVGISPTALQKLANPVGENGTAQAATTMGTIMIFDSYASNTLEEVAAAVPTTSHLWQQLYIFVNRSYTIDIVRRAEKNGFKALVLTCDEPILGPSHCNAKTVPEIANAPLGNFPGETYGSLETDVTTFDDIRWLKSITELPIVAKGLLRGDDAQKAVQAGASAILVSNQGGRQLDSDVATVDALPEVVDAINQMFPAQRVDVYVDGGIRNGYDVYKALARGAKMVFIGRPALWGLTLMGEEGVENVLNILKTEFNSTMILAGSKNPSEISSDTAVPAFPTYG